MGLSQTYYTEHIELILIFGLVGFILNKIALHKHFYKLPETPFEPKVTFPLVALSFSIYLVNSFFLAPLLLKKFHSLFPSLMIAASWIQVLVMFFSLLMILGASQVLMKDFRSLLKKTNESSFFQDILWAMTTWILAFPLVGVTEQFADLLVYAFFGIETYEQEAVAYLKMALKSPSQLTAALILILVTAPFMEELLFRGFLQNWIKRHLGVKAAILIASLCFALFHISASHGAGNFSLVLSLFVFACFLGFLYEKQRSLFASIALHSVFNLISVLRIIFTIDV